jgi:hypothetical protein
MRALFERGILALTGMIAVVVMFTPPAQAGSSVHERWHGRWKSEHSSGSHHKSAARPKDCTRYNGRWGYYGNPWCTRAEQRAFDIWDARRIERLRRGG